MVKGDASSSSGKGPKRKGVSSGGIANKKQKIIAQADSPEWPSYFHDVRDCPLPTTLRPIECFLVIQGALFCSIRPHPLIAYRFVTPGVQGMYVRDMAGART